ncbi:MAG: type 4a pilus biogenesis protein PilO [bacterium]|nr:type 4a pilus biogenesis protein PilO [bacterium]
MSTRTRIITTVAIIVIGMATIIGFVFIPSLYGIVNLSKNISREQNKIEQAISRASQHRTITSLTEQIERELPTYQRMIIESGKEIDFFSLLEEKNKQHNLTQLIRLSPSVELSPSLEELPLEFQIQGDFSDIIAYISELEHMPELISFNSLNILRVPLSQDNKKPLSLTLKGAIYVLKK